MQSLDIQTLMSTIKDNINIDDELKRLQKISAEDYQRNFSNVVNGYSNFGFVDI